jgi:hypothetical protein
MSKPVSESLPTVLAAVEAAGYVVSKPQLWRLVSAGIIGEPNVESLGRGRGKDSHYPPGTIERVIRALGLAEEERRLPERAWLIWWLDGGEMSAAARAFVHATAAELDNHLREIKKLLRGNTAGDEEAVAKLDEIYVGAETERVSGPFAQARKRIGKSRASSLAQFFLELASGTFKAFPVDSLEGSSTSAARLVEKALGLDRARSETVSGSEPWMQGDLEIDFARLASILRGLSFESQAAASDDSLDRARAEMRSFQEVIASAAEGADLLLGRGAFGFRPLANAFAVAGYQGQVFFVLAWQEMRKEEELRNGMTQIVDCLGQARAMQEAGQTLAYLRDAVPAYRKLLSPRRIGKALHDPASHARFDEELNAIRLEHAEAIDAALAARRSRSPSA